MGELHVNSMSSVLNQVDTATKSWTGKNYASLAQKVLHAPLPTDPEKIKGLRDRVSDIRSKLSWGFSDCYYAVRNRFWGTNLQTDRAKLQAGLQDLEEHLSKADFLKNYGTKGFSSAHSYTDQILGGFYATDGTLKEGLTPEKKEAGLLLLDVVSIIPEGLREEFSKKICDINKGTESPESVRKAITDWMKDQKTMSPELRTVINICISDRKGKISEIKNKCDSNFGFLQGVPEGIKNRLQKTYDDFSLYMKDPRLTGKDRERICQEFHAGLSASNIPPDKKREHIARLCDQMENRFQSLRDRYEATGAGAVGAVLDRVEVARGSRFGESYRVLAKDISEATNGLSGTGAKNYKNLLDKTRELKGNIPSGRVYDSSGRKELIQALGKLEITLSDLSKKTILQEITPPEGKDQSAVGSLIGKYYKNDGSQKKGDQNFLDSGELLLDVLSEIPENLREEYAGISLAKEDGTPVRMIVEEIKDFLSKNRLSAPAVLDGYDVDFSLNKVKNLLNRFTNPSSESSDINKIAENLSDLGIIEKSKPLSKEAKNELNNIKTNLNRMVVNPSLSCKRKKDLCEEVAKSLSSPSINPESDFARINELINGYGKGG